jgi:hypothetical protein
MPTLDVELDRDEVFALVRQFDAADRDMLLDEMLTDSETSGPTAEAIRSIRDFVRRSDLGIEDRDPVEAMRDLTLAFGWV